MIISNEICNKIPNPLYWQEGPTRQYLETLKKIYNKDLVDSIIYFQGKIVHVREKDDPRGVYNSFDHVSCETIFSNGERIKQYEQERCARIPWIKTILEMVECKPCIPDIFRIWQEPTRKNPRKKDTVIWCTNTNYVIVLANEPNSFVIRSAYCILYKDKLKELTKNYLKYSYI